jgi:hypothetical protein
MEIIFSQLLTEASIKSDDVARSQEVHRRVKHCRKNLISGKELRKL